MRRKITSSIHRTTDGTTTSHTRNGVPRVDCCVCYDFAEVCGHNYKSIAELFFISDFLSGSSTLIQNDGGFRL